ncbi:hypothetical protein FGO68_gene6110 [Halteria grandinella]|uniref:Uncharacterized protein n=1 Tax=Halteria grandinella TaxID=5974 RepID=A0A8J8NSG1_HALGN|nr:hypothetical protein FGO68_gene6110 [Halteria grandinella]
MSACQCPGCEIDRDLNSDQSSPQDIASCPYVFNDKDEYPPNPFENQRHGAGVNAEYSYSQESEGGESESVGAKRLHDSTDIQTDNSESTSSSGPHQRSMDDRKVQRTVEIPQGEIENLKEETKASHPDDQSLFTAPKAKKRTTKQLSKDLNEGKKKLLGEMFDTDIKILVKRIMHSIFRNYKKYILKKKLPFAREVQQEVQIEIGEIEYNALVQRLTDAVCIHKKVNGKWVEQQNLSLFQMLMYKYQKSALLELDLPSLRSMVIVLPNIAQNVEYRNTEKKRLETTEDLPQELFVEKITELVEIIKGVILGIQQESE